ncbi:MAG: hypothetical protein HS101_01920 [Planctomycetia bacterium]|nr:hypothetical protein [Planctomycetia bacterium]OQZ07319.1 MAG: hypothetical protein B6D36_00485 [Planctomycetes bacterium UTPLA1]
MLFNSRTAVQKKIDSIRKSMTSAYAGSFADCREFLTREGNKSPFNILDGPIWRLSPLEHVHYRLRTLFNMAAARSATRASLALSCYRHDRGEYPESISELVPQWLSEIPRDSFTDQALGYARLPDVDDYIIYSVGSDLVDDKGKRRSRVGQDADDNTTYDIVYDHVRGKQLWAESKLERISK